MSITTIIKLVSVWFISKADRSKNTILTVYFQILELF